MVFKLMSGGGWMLSDGLYETIKRHKQLRNNSVTDSERLPKIHRMLLDPILGTFLPIEILIQIPASYNTVTYFSLYSNILAD